MAATATGCCCLSGYNRCNPCGNPCGGYSGYAPASPCGPGGCAPQYGPMGYIPGDTSTAFAPTSSLAAATPAPLATQYPTTAFAPTQSLPTY